MLRKICLLLISTAMLDMCVPTLAADPNLTYTDPAAAGPDFQTQGEYVSEHQPKEGKNTRGAQIIALGDGKFHAVVYQGGLPGAGWDKSKTIQAEGQSADGVATFATKDLTAKIQRGVMTLHDTEGKTTHTLKKILRKSPTLAAKPPAEAVVLFDGTTAKAFDGGRMTDDGLLMEGSTSKRKFRDFTLHMEFRTPFKPFARGQHRGNSGFYAQGRYEVQILDSFGLEGVDNECGGIYKVACPSVNMCLPPLSWQTYDVDFTAARFKDGKKVKNATMTVRHNGVEIHKNLEVPFATTAAPVGEGVKPGPIYLQKHGNPVRFRNIWVIPRDSVPKSSKREGRAVWNHSGAGAYPGDWERSMKLLADNGFNMILPNMLWGGLAHYASDVLPRSNAFRKYGDQIERCCAAGRKHGIGVHVWKVHFNLCTAPKDFVEKLRQEGRTQLTVDGKPSNWLCPSHPDNQKLELKSMLEVARKYPVDGLHLDYIRYPGRKACYCDGCRRRFEAQSGRKVSDWPNECFSGKRKEEYNDWRCRQITSLVERISREAKKIRPEIKISAAVFGSYPDCRRSIAQDWPEWIKEGHLDFICPMDYTTDDAVFTSLVRNQTKLVDGRVPLYVGIGATATGIAMTSDRVKGQIHLARSLGANGFTIFNFSPKTASTLIPHLGLNTAEAPNAAPPHGKP